MIAAKSAPPFLDESLRAYIPGARGVVGTFAASGSRMVVVAARHLIETLHGATNGGGLYDSNSLLSHVEFGWNAEGGSLRTTPTACAPAEDLLGASVYLDPTSPMPRPGRVTALRGAVRLKFGGAEGVVIATNLIEIALDAITFDKLQQPELSRRDAGALVTTSNFLAAGLLIAGSGYRGIVVPLAPYFAAHGLSFDFSHVQGLAPSGASTPRTDLQLPRGRYSLLDDLARESRLDLGSLPDILEAA
jgi:hypothetical protein